MGGGGVRIEETGQPAGRTRGTKGDGRDESERCRQMGGGGMRRGNTTTSLTRGLEVGGARRVAGVVSRHGRRLLDGEVRRSTAMNGAAPPRRQGTARRLLDGKGRRNGSSTARDGASAAAMDREHNGDGRRWTARWQMDGDGRRGATVMDGVTATTRRQGTARW